MDKYFFGFLEHLAGISGKTVEEILDMAVNMGIDWNNLGDVDRIIAHLVRKAAAK